MLDESPADHARAILAKRVRKLLNGCLGAIPYPFNVPSSPRGRLPDSPWIKAAIAGVAYALLFCGLPWLLVERPEQLLFWLSVYGSLYAAWATLTARLTSSAILRVIERRLITDLSSTTAYRIDADLARHFSEARLSWVSWTLAILGIFAAAVAISRDVGNAPFEVAWWSVGFLILFVTAARATDVARFYYYFAKHLHDEPSLYVLDPARSSLVRSVSAVGKHVLLFWAGILLAVAFLIPFIVLGSDGSEFRDTGWGIRLPVKSEFAFVVIPITSAFSIPFGTMVFLRSENAIRTAVDNVLYDTLRSTEREVTDLLARRDELSEFEWKRVAELRLLHKELTTSGPYRSVLVSGVSLLIPLIGPIAAILSKSLTK